VPGKNKRIAIIDGHPDPDRARFVHALADSYADGAVAGGHDIRRIEVANLDVPILRSRAEWESPSPEGLRHAAEAIAWADHLVLLYPLWLGDVPALLKGFLEQVLRPGDSGLEGLRKALKGKSAHVVVTMGMPGLFYTLFYRAHSLKSLERSILKLVGVRPVHHTIIGGVEGDPDDRKHWLDKMLAAGERGD